MAKELLIKASMLSFGCAQGMNIIAGIGLAFMMLLTGCDIVGRAFGHPVPGTYEIVSALGGVVAGLALPLTSWVHGHVTVDLLVEKLSRKKRTGLIAITRLMGAALFLLMGYGITCIGLDLQRSEEVTPVLRLPSHLVAYGMGAAFFIESVVLIINIFRPEERSHE